MTTPTNRMIPFPIPESEWSFQAMPEKRQSFLLTAPPFEDTVSAMLNGCVATDIRTKRFGDGKGPQKKARQVIITIRLRAPELCDRFFNSRDGLRGRYWQSCEHGVLATRYALDQFMPFLLETFDHAPDDAKIAKGTSSLSREHAVLSLQAASAKIWPAETNLGDVRGANYPSIDVGRWRKNQPSDGYDSWRWSPDKNEIDVKGALIDLDGYEHVPEEKRDRAFKIHSKGFT